MIEKVNMSPVIMEKIMVTKGPVNLIALKNKDCVALEFPGTYPAKKSR